MNPETMRYLAVILLSVIIVSALVAGSIVQHVCYDELDLTRMAEAIRQTENTPWYHIGAALERSSYQITPAVWKQHTIAAFSWASCPDPQWRGFTEKVVEAHLAWICRELKKHGYTLTPYSVAGVWKGGYGRFFKMQMRPEDTAYAFRCANLYAEAGK